MATAKKSITVDAPVEKIFEYLNQPINLLEIWPSMVEAKDIQPTKWRQQIQLGIQDGRHAL